MFDTTFESKSLSEHDDEDAQDEIPLITAAANVEASDPVYFVIVTLIEAEPVSPTVGDLHKTLTVVLVL